MTRNIVTCYIGLLFLIIACAKGIKIIHVNKGSGIMIQCNVTIATIHTDIYWTKNSTDSTFNVTGINLVFNDISSAVDGEYICHSMNRKTGENITLETIQVMVNYAATVKAINVTPSVMQENDTFTVTCEFDGSPAPKWQIRLKDSIIAIGHGSGVHTTKVKTGTCGDTGHVTCNAKNSVSNNSASLTQNITVFCSPRPIWLNRYKLTAPVGGFTALIMMAHGFPYPSYVWSRDDGKPMRNPTQTDLPEISILNITNIQTSDFGNYSLTMNNSYGSYVAHYQLLQSGPSNNNGNNALSQYNSDKCNVIFGIITTMAVFFTCCRRH
ncbi:roundabout homolog 1-like [Ruditapes philippinarum]|uniref:roundabout homolog 1-like n=1 Tax=Ruditapes philippinarum TaxID=129788 RepID=UPI00295AFC6B|nr:roundabout homolog 1-like [Ruditapes philippinarum]